MEYVLTNIKAQGFNEYKSVHYKGGFQFNDNSLTILEGDIYSGRKEDILSGNVKGVYVYIKYDFIKNKIIIKNDQIGYHTIYIFNNGSNFVISNNFWEIIKLIDEDKLEINDILFKSYLYYTHIPIEGVTYFDNITELPSASIAEINLDSNKLSIKKYWEYIQEADSSISLDEAIEISDNALFEFFSSVKDKYSNKTFAFGNSGGLDSRLIPLYMKKVGIDIKGFTIGNEKPNGKLFSITHKNAMMIAHKLGFETHNIDYRHNIYKKRMELDIRNNPFGSCEIFKNTYEKLPEFDIMFCAGDGFIVAANPMWSVLPKNNNTDDLKDIFSDFIAKEKLCKETFNILFTPDEKQNMKELFMPFVLKNRYKDHVSLIRSFHQCLGNRQSPNGGFESINKKKKSLNIYYPFVFDVARKFKNEIFQNRALLSGLILKNNRELAEIPDQNLNPLFGSRSRVRTEEYKLRGHGLDYYNWIKDENYLKFALEILNRKNPLFEKYFSANRLISSGILSVHPHAGIDFIKAKKLLDIIYYKEYDFIDNEEYRMES